MDQPINIGVDLAKNVFQVHGVSSEGTVIVRRQLRRSQMLLFFSRLDSCLVGMEACASAHYRGRELMARGHEVRLMPPAYVKPYVKRGKTDAANAEAICEAVTRPTMRVTPKACLRHDARKVSRSPGGAARSQGAGLPGPSADPREVSAILAHLGEFGVVVPKGIHNAGRLLEAVGDVPEAARPVLDLLADQLDEPRAVESTR